MRCLLALILSLLIPLARGGATQAELWLSDSAAKPGSTITAAVHLKMQPRWHTYWRNPGDSGKATKIQWDLPKGISAGEIQWPTPEKNRLEDLYTYVYHNETALLVPLTIAADAPSGPQKIKATVSWLECEVSCIPGKQVVEATLGIGPESKPSPEAARIQDWKSKIPQQKNDIEITAEWEAPKGDERKIIFTVNKPEGAWELFNDRLENADVSGNSEPLPPATGKVRFSKTVKKFEGDWPAQMTGLLLTPSDPTTAREVKVAIGGGAATSASTTAAVTSPPTPASPKQTLLPILGLAFLGGLILNIMPCVLPVIALKILGFVRQSNENPARIRKLGLVYALGVIVSFMILAGFVIAIRQSAGSATWGMQMQNPKFVMSMAVLVTLIALSLFGVFEINIGGAAGAAGQLASREGASGAFFNGAFATLLATPCTAPFLAPALGFAFTQSAAIIALTFLTVAVGMSFPYVLLSWYPQWLKKLPRPGPWMEKFKQAMGFPMIATAIWLLSVLLAQFGKHVALPFGLFLASISFAAWIYGDFVQRGSARRGLSMGIVVAVVAAAGFYFLPQIKKLQDEWQPWSVAAVESTRAQGKPVLVDFTAEWCLTCKLNKKILDTAAVKEKLRELGVVTMVADNTGESPEIAAELKKYNRAGVPMVLIFGGNSKEPAILLPEVLTPGIVLDALNKAAAGGPKLSGK